MKRRLLAFGLASLALVAFASMASAAGINFSWTNCYSDGAVSNRNFACNSNSGSNTMVASYVTPDAGILQVSGNEVVADFGFADTSVPAWWQFKNTGTCRSTAMSMNFIPPASLAVCQDYWAGQAAGGVGAYQIGTVSGANVARIVAAIAVPQSAITDEAGATEYFSCNIVVNNTKTVGTGACAGCTTPGCFTLNSINVTTPVLANNVKLTTPAAAAGSNSITWQGGAGVSTNLGAGCPSATPTQNRTWGQIKSLYR